MAGTTVGANPIEPTAPPLLPTDFTPQEIQAADDYHRQYADLEKAGEGQPKSALAPDRFLLMEQSVFPKEVPVARTFVQHIFRRWSLKALHKKTDNYIKRLDAGSAQAQPFAKVLSDSEIRTALMKHINDGRRADTPLFLWERSKDRAQLEAIQTALLNVEKTWDFNNSQNSGNEAEAPYERRVRTINWWDAKVQVQENDAVVKTLDMKDTTAGVNTASDQPYFCSAKGCRFNIVKDGSVLHVFGVQSQVVGTFDQYVVFTHTDSYDPATGTQYLSFLDLGTYNGLIGNEEIPVFRLPLKIDEPVRSLNVRDGRLVLNDKFFIEREYFENASDMQQVAFNLQANVINPDSWAKVLPLVDSVQEYFNKVIRQELKSKADESDGLREAGVLMEQLGKELETLLNTQKLMKPMTADEHKKLGEKIANTGNGGADAVAERLELYHKRVSQSAILAKIMGQTQERARVSRQLSTRVRLLAASLLSPRPFASQKIKEALGAWFVRHEDADGQPAGWSKMMDRVLRLTDRPFVNAGVISAAILAAVAPSTFHTLVQSGLSFSTAIVDYMVWSLHGMGQSGVTGTHATFAPFVNPIQAIGDQYVKNGNWWRTGIGLSAFLSFLGSLYFVPHFIFNFAQLYKDLKKPGINGFVDRQNKFRQEYYARLAADEGERRNVGNGEAVKFNEDEEADIQAFLKQRQEEAGKRRFFGLLGHKTDVTDTIDAAADNQVEELSAAVDAAAQSTAVAKAVNESEDDFRSFWVAAKHFAFSMPALELTLERWAGIWNAWASWRFTTFGFGYVKILGTEVPLYLKVKPVSFAARIMYPEFMSKALFSRQGRAIIPTQTNGGLKSRCTQAFQRACGLLNFATGAGYTPRQQLQALEKFENQVIGAEEQITEVAFRKALEHLPKFMTDKDDLRTLFNSKSLDSITQRDVQTLSWGAKTFLRAHFESIYNAGMQKFLAETLDQREGQPDAPSQDMDIGTVPPSDITADTDSDQEVAQRSLAEMKKALVRLQAPNGEQADYAFDVERAKGAALAVANDPVHYQNAEAAVKAGSLSVGNFALNAKYNLVADLDPKQNYSMARVETVHRRLQSPGALGRALRSEISKLKLTFPIDLTTKLLLSAGIFEGAMKPIQDQLWGPNSTFYLSHTSFYMIMASGFFMSMMADAWMKLQQDARQDDMGEFGHIPQGEDSERSFVRWYYKQFAAKENSLMKNWGFSNSLSFWNLPAALTNITLFYFMFSGRIDLSLLMAGYAIGFGTPVTALHYKVDQAFERAAHFAARGVKDEKWLAHPDVQKFLVPEMQRYRDRFTLVNDIYGNIQNNWLANIEMIPTDLGPRGFQRALFGGGLLEEYIVNYAIQPLQNLVSGVPGLQHVVSPVLNACQNLLTRGNTDLINIHK